MSPVQKKLIVISGDLFVRNYLKSDALHGIEDENTYFVALSDVTLRSELESRKNFLGYLDYTAKEIARFYFILDVLMYRYRDRSRTFAYRYKRLVHGLFQELTPGQLKTSRYYRLGGLPLAFAARAVKLSPQFLRQAMVAVLGQPLVAGLSKRIYNLLSKPNDKLERILRDLKPDLVLFPSSAIDIAGNDLVRLKQKLGSFRNFFLVDNWDNLSSKSVFMYPPDYLGVWGQQSVEHAGQIHHISPEKVIRMGTPRFERYYETVEKVDRGNAPPASPYPFSYILFAGCAIPFDELGAVRMMDRVLDQMSPAERGNLKIVYRPHPWRQRRSCPDHFEASEFKHVILDEQIRENYYNPQKKGLFQPSLDYYPALLMNAQFVVCPLTTMLVEAALFRRKILIIAYDDGVHITSPHNALKNYRHFEGLTDVPGLVFSHDRSRFEKEFGELVRSGANGVDWSLQQEKIGYFLYRDPKGYPKRLQEAVSHLIHSKGTQSL